MHSSDRSGSLAVTAFVGMVGVVLAWAWLHRADGLLTPEEGPGYWLGVVGATMMLAVLLYPLRKRAGFMRDWIRLPNWFRFHMVFGIVGPALIVIHANFGADSLNALAALVSMLAVVGSGIAGRYLYARIHRGLYGAKLEVRELLADAKSMRAIIGEVHPSQAFEKELQELERIVAEPTPSLYRAIANAVRLQGRIGNIRRTVFGTRAEPLTMQGAGSPRRAGALFRERVAHYLDAVARAASFLIYDRLFSLWHVLHLPLIILLVATAMIHVIAVHLY